MEKFVFTSDQIDYITSIVGTWVQTCHDNNRSVTPSDVRHSALLCRLLRGLPLLEYPPPKSFSYPNYSLVESEETLIGDFWERDKDEDIIYDGKPYDGPVVVIDQHADYIWEDKKKSIVVHLPTGLRFEYYLKTAYPLWVANGDPEDHPYMGKFLRKLPPRYTLKRSFFMGAGSCNEHEKDFNLIKHVFEHMANNKLDCEWDWLLIDNVTGRWLADTSDQWKRYYGIIRMPNGTWQKEENLKYYT